MDQPSLYEMQLGPGKVPEDVSENPLARRDDFVVNYIRACVADADVDIVVAELSIGDGGLSRALLESVSRIQLTCADISTRRLTYAHNRKLVWNAG